jgi:hypothetical protein
MIAYRSKPPYHALLNPWRRKYLVGSIARWTE